VIEKIVFAKPDPALSPDAAVIGKIVHAKPTEPCPPTLP